MATMKNRRKAWILAGVLGVAVTGTIYAFIQGHHRVGIRRTSYPDGSLMSERQYRDGDLHGLSQRFTPEGDLSMKVYFVNNMPCCGVTEVLTFADATFTNLDKKQVKYAGGEVVEVRSATPWFSEAEIEASLTQCSFHKDSP